MKTILKVHFLLLLIVPFIVFAQQQKPQDGQQKKPLLTSYDSDGDGIPDSTDQCVLIKGSKSFKGCPYQKKITTMDRDGDGMKDEFDKCPDMFGLEANMGCPEIQTPKDTKERSAVDGNSSLFTTTSSLSGEEAETFKETLGNIMAAPVAQQAPRDEVAVAAEAGTGIPTASCLPGANKCYLSKDTKTFYADFGQYTNQQAAAEKYYTLRQKLAESLPESQWEGSEYATGGYISTFEMTKKNKVAGSPVVTTHVDKVGEVYHVYITVNRK